MITEEDVVDTLAVPMSNVLYETRKFHSAHPDDVRGMEAAWHEAVNTDLCPVINQIFPLLVEQALENVGLAPLSVAPHYIDGYADAHVKGVQNYAELLGGVAYRYPDDPEAVDARLSADRIPLLCEPLAIHLLNAAHVLALQGGSGVRPLVAVALPDIPDSELPNTTTMHDELAPDDLNDGNAHPNPLYRTKRWRTMGDQYVRPAHVATENQTVPVSHPFDVVGFPAMYPGDPSLPPSLRINCRCRIETGDDLTHEQALAIADEMEAANIPVTPSSMREAVEQLPLPGTNTDQFVNLPSPGDRTITFTQDGFRMVNETVQSLADEVPEFTFDGTVYGQAPSSVNARWTGSWSDENGHEVMEFNRKIERDSEGLYVKNDYFRMDREYQGQGIGSRILEKLDNLYRRMGITRTKLNADIDVGGYAWARAGYDWDHGHPSPFGNVPNAIYREMNFNTDLLTTDPEYLQLEAWRNQLNSWAYPQSVEDLPTPFDIAMFGYDPAAAAAAKAAGREYIWSGKRIMLGTDWYGVRYL